MPSDKVTIRMLKCALQKAINDYGKPGGPWNVPREPGTWISMAMDALDVAKKCGPEAIGKPTPGPWRATALLVGACNIMGDTSGNTLVARALDNSSLYQGECEANARLIAAAPDMLAALDTVANVLESDGVIVKTGNGDVHQFGINHLSSLAKEIRAVIAKAEDAA